MINQRTAECRRRKDPSERIAKVKNIIVAAIAVVCLLGASGTSASSFEDEWSKLIAAAKKEGRVVVAAGGQPSRQYRPVLEVFQKKFGIKAEISTGGARDTINRVLAERKAKVYSFDVALISVRINNLRLVPLGALIPLSPLLIHPEVVNTSNWYGNKHWYGDKDLKHTFIYHASVEDDYESWYNTDKIKEKEMRTIKGQWDFFDPRWKGKIQGQGMGDPSGIRQMIDSWYERERGPKWVKTYLTEGGVTFAEDRRILETWLVSGRFPLRAVSSSETELRVLAKKGLPVKSWFLPRQEGILRATGSGCCISVFDNAPHPNAVKLFVNWFLSKEGQTLTHELIPALDRASMRTDVSWGKVIEDQRRDNSKTYRFPDAEPGSAVKYQEAQKEIMKIWDARKK